MTRVVKTLTTPKRYGANIDLPPGLVPLMNIAVAVVTAAVASVLTSSDVHSQQIGTDSPPAQVKRPGFAGAKACGSCHQKQYTAWRRSHHFRAMEVASNTTVRGDFSNTTFTYRGFTSTFFRKDNKFFVRTAGPEGKLHAYQIMFTFGISPLQQYLVRFPNGRLQALTVAWDTRAKSAGGQRWFHLQQGRRVRPGDPLHWTKPAYNWNFMCADCHSTSLQKAFNLKTNSYRTVFSEPNVACEACHGPGAKHVRWAAEVKSGKPATAGPTKGLVVRLKDPGRFDWIFKLGRKIAQRRAPASKVSLTETCGRCHARRSVLSRQFAHGQPLTNSHLPALLRDDLYFPDGQIRDEVYVYGSFLQSRMAKAGVTCVNCHDPHSQKLLAKGNTLCAQCHKIEAFNTPKHHRHKKGSKGAQCVSCHMPARTYMVIDPRRDHSFRIPRPDLTIRIGTPNACNQCHENKSAKWAAQTVASWYGSARTTKPHYGEILHAGRLGAPGSAQNLGLLAADKTVPGIVRATAIRLMGRQLGASTLQAIRAALDDIDPLVRAAAVRALTNGPPRLRSGLLVASLTDKVRAVRIETGRALIDIPPAQFREQDRLVLLAAIGEYRASLRANDDSAAAHVERGVYLLRKRRFVDAEKSLRTAIRIDPDAIAAYVNLADLYRLQRNDEKAVSILQTALKQQPESADAHHALGLAFVRQRRLGAAILHLHRATTLAPGNPRYSYVYGIALKSSNRTEAAIGVLKDALNRHPYNVPILYALATIHLTKGDKAAAHDYARRLVELRPQSRRLRGLFEQTR